MTTRADVVVEARTWIGTRWHHLGRIKGVACDCAGLVIGVARALRLPDFDVTGYGTTPHAGTLRRLCDENMRPIGQAEPQPGDVALMSWGSEPQHLAIFGDYPGGMSLIHAWAAARKVTVDRSDGSTSRPGSAPETKPWWAAHWCT